MITFYILFMRGNLNNLLQLCDLQKCNVLFTIFSLDYLLVASRGYTLVNVGLLLYVNVNLVCIMSSGGMCTLIGRGWPMSVSLTAGVSTIENISLLKYRK